MLLIGNLLSVTLCFNIVFWTLRIKKKSTHSFTYRSTQPFKTSLERRAAVKLISLPTEARHYQRRQSISGEDRRAVNTHGTRITRPRRKPRLGVFNQRHERAEKRERVAWQRSIQSGRNRHKRGASNFSCHSDKKGNEVKFSVKQILASTHQKKKK